MCNSDFLKNKLDKEIVFLTIHLREGGAERVVGMLSSAWARMGYRVRIVELSANMGAGKHYVVDSKVVLEQHYFEGNKYWRTLQMLSFLLPYLRKNTDKQFVVFNCEVHLMLFFIYKVLGNNVLVSERGDPYQCPPKEIYRGMRNTVFEKFARACVFQTIDAMSYFNKKTRSKAVIIPNPVNPNLPERWKGKRRKVIVAAGRLSYEKNWKMCIEAFSKFSELHSDYSLEIYGQGSQKEEILNLIHSLSMDSKILLKGFANNVNELMRDCAVYVSSSDLEGISNSMIEAMAMGMPVVCTDCPIGGARMMIQNDVNGLLVPVGDVEALYLAFRRLVEEPSLAERLGWEAYKVRERYSIDRIAKRWLEVICKEVGSNI